MILLYKGRVDVKVHTIDNQFIVGNQWHSRLSMSLNKRDGLLLLKWLTPAHFLWHSPHLQNSNIECMGTLWNTEAAYSAMYLTSCGIHSYILLMTTFLVIVATYWQIKYKFLRVSMWCNQLQSHILQQWDLLLRSLLCHPSPKWPPVPVISTCYWFI